MAFGIQLVKLTNGTNNDTAPGPSVPVGSTVTFTYIVTNANTAPDTFVPLAGVTVQDDDGTPAIPADDFNPTFVGGDTNGNTFLDFGETFTFTASRIATPLQYTNSATASALPLSSATPVFDTDVDNHFGGVAPPIGINIVKLTNGTDNDTAPGAVVPVGSTVTFSYVVTNPGSLPLAGVTVRDDDGTPGNPADDFNAIFTGGDTNANGLLDTSETFVFTASRIATPGLYTNVATATGTPPSGFGPPVSATASDNHSGNTPPNDIAGGPFTVQENSATGTIVGTVVGHDPEGQALTYSLTDDASGRFAINGVTGQITVADGSLLDFEQASSHGITVQVTDPGSLSFQEAFVVNIGDVNETIPNDFNDDGRGDILWQHANGTPAVWLMNGTEVAVIGPSLANPGPAWHARDAGDFNADGKADILWQNDNGSAAIWLMDGTSPTAYGPPLANLAGPAWQAKEAADFNGDGKSDILWQNADGTPAVWLMNGVNVLSTGPALANPGPAWQIKDAADFNGDGKADILWQNTDGRAAIWLMDGTNAAAFGPALDNLAGPAWQAIEAGDFNADGKADILWQNTDGRAAVWLMDGTGVVSYGAPLANPGPTWKVEDATHRPCG
jgi:hypothetical protein